MGRSRMIDRLVVFPAVMIILRHTAAKKNRSSKYMLLRLNLRLPDLIASPIAGMWCG